MSEAKLDLIAHIVSGLCASLDFVVPYYSIGGVNLGQCKYCKAVGVLHYPDIVYTHAPDCLIALADRLHRGLQQEQGQKGMSEGDWEKLTAEQQSAVNVWRDRVGKMIVREGDAFEALYPELRLIWNFTSEPLLRSEHPVIYEGL